MSIITTFFHACGTLCEPRVPFWRSVRAVTSCTFSPVRHVVAARWHPPCARCSRLREAPGVRAVGSRGSKTFRAGRFMRLNMLSRPNGNLFGLHVRDSSAGRPGLGPLRRPAVRMHSAAGRTEPRLYVSGLVNRGQTTTKAARKPEIFKPSPKRASTRF